ncbi:unnamed protein product, partial [Symbiodinium necroappetens]
SEAILDFSTKLGLAGPNFDADVCGNDPEQIKYYDCQWWCMRLARTRETHFAENDAFDIVCPNLRDLLRHCADEDASMRTSAHYIVRNYGKGGLRFVQQMIADAMLTLMENLLSESTGMSQATLTQVMQCTGHLDNVVRTLAKPQRQRWVSLLVKALESLRGHESETLTLIADLKLLWRADDDPCRAYAEAEQQLTALKKQANKDVGPCPGSLIRKRHISTRPCLSTVMFDETPKRVNANASPKAAPPQPPPGPVQDAAGQELSRFVPRWFHQDAAGALHHEKGRAMILIQCEVQKKACFVTVLLQARVGTARHVASIASLGAQFHVKHEETDSVRTLCDAVLLAGEQGQDGGEEALKGIREFFGSHKVSVDSMLLVLDSNAVVGCAWQAELEEALECLAAQKKRQEKMIAEMERQTAQIQKKMEVRVKAWSTGPGHLDCRVGTELKERIEALQACRVVDYCR